MKHSRLTPCVREHGRVDKGRKGALHRFDFATRKDPEQATEHTPRLKGEFVIANRAFPQTSELDEETSNEVNA